MINSALFKVINKAFKQMRNRNTIGDQWKPNNNQRNLVNSVQRKTMTNPQNSTQIQSRQTAQQHQNQKMCQKINKVLTKFPQQGKRTSISSIIQPKASTLYSNISTFINSIDHSFQKSNIEIQTIQQLLTFWGYPHNYNKSVFQPIGALHTWPACLQMMEFTADIANYIFEYRATTEQYKLDVEQIDILLQAFTKQDCSLYDCYLEKQRALLTKQQSDLVFKIQSSELALKNIKNSQRSISDLQAEQSIILQKLHRESQNVIEIDQKNNSIINEIQKIDDTMEQLQITKRSLQKKIQMLEQQISHQQLSAEEASRIQLQIKQYHSKIKDAHAELEQKKKQYQTQKNKKVELFYKIVDDLNEIKNSVRTYQGQLQSRNIEISLPESNHVAFTQAIHTQDVNIFNQNINKMLEVDKIKSMSISQQALADVLEHQTKVMSNQIAELQMKKSQTDNQNKQHNSEVHKLNKFSTQLKKQLQILSNKQNRVIQQKQELKLKINAVKSRSEQLLQKQIELTQQIKQRKQDMVEGVKFLKKYDISCDQAIKKLQNKQVQTIKKIEEILERLQGGFNYLNKELQGLL